MTDQELSEYEKMAASLRRVLEANAGREEYLVDALGYKQAEQALGLALAVMDMAAEIRRLRDELRESKGSR